MLKNLKCPVIALEEHYWDKELAAHYPSLSAGRGKYIDDRLYDLGALRLKEMDEAGIDMQVLSHGAPSTQRLPIDIAAKLTAEVNDRLAAFCAGNPSRFAAFAALPTIDPAAAARELERAVTTLKFKGAMLHGMTNGEFLDHRKYWPIYEMAERLDVPLYLHPSMPPQQVSEIYYQDYVKDFPLMMRPGWGYTVDTATHAIRMVLSGMFEAYPNLKVILGHLGETLPFLLWRIDDSLRYPGQKKIDFRHIFCKNFHVTTSGFFSNAALLCSMMEMGVDQIMFAVDWPFVANDRGVQWMEGVPLCDADKSKILSGNAKRLLRI